MNTKQCTSCGRILPATRDFFYANGTRLASECGACRRAYQKKHREMNGDRVREQKRAYWKKNYEKIRVSRAKYRRENRERILARQKEYEKDHREEYRSYKHAYRLRKRYGMTAEEYSALFTSQRGVCAICGLAETYLLQGRRTKLQVDHDHQTGQVRGLLCYRCNRLLAFAKDDPVILGCATAYLRSERSVFEHTSGALR